MSTYAKYFTRLDIVIGLYNIYKGGHELVKSLKYNNTLNFFLKLFNSICELLYCR